VARDAGQMQAAGEHVGQVAFEEDGGVDDGLKAEAGIVGLDEAAQAFQEEGGLGVARGAVSQGADAGLEGRDV